MQQIFMHLFCVMLRASCWVYRLNNKHGEEDLKRIKILKNNFGFGVERDSTIWEDNGGARGAVEIRHDDVLSSGGSKQDRKKHPDVWYVAGKMDSMHNDRLWGNWRKGRRELLYRIL